MSQTRRVMLALAAGLALGVALGFAGGAWATTVRGVVAAAETAGALWVNGIRMTVVPLIVSLLVVGVASTGGAAGDTTRVGRLGLRAFALFYLSLAAVALFVALVAPPLFALFPHNPALRGALDHAVVSSAAQTGPVSWSAALVAMVPSNAIMAAAQSAMLPLVVFALFLGFALTRIAPARRAA